MGGILVVLALTKLFMEQNSFKTLMWILLGLVVVVVGVLLLTKKKDMATDENMVIGTAAVESVDILKLESFPVQVQVVAKGNLPDGCTSLGDVKQMYDGKSDFSIRLETKRPLDESCTQALVPFEKSFMLSAATGLAKGTYTVDVNGVKKSFTLEMDNFINENDPLK